LRKKSSEGFDNSYQPALGGLAPGGSVDCVPGLVPVADLTSGSVELRRLLRNRRKTGFGACDKPNPKAAKLLETTIGREAIVT